MSETSDCIFCKIISGNEPGQLLYQDEEVVVLKDIKPAAKHHYLSVPKEHIINVNSLTSDHKALLEKMIQCGKQVLEENGGDSNDIRLGFHCPPFHSVLHLHLHVISPASQISLLHRIAFTPNTWWFQSVDKTLENLDKLVNGKL